MVIKRLVVHGSHDGSKGVVTEEQNTPGLVTLTPNTPISPPHQQHIIQAPGTLPVPQASTHPVLALSTKPRPSFSMQQAPLPPPRRRQLGPRWKSKPEPPVISPYSIKQVIVTRGKCVKKLTFAPAAKPEGTCYDCRRQIVDEEDRQAVAAAGRRKAIAEAERRSGKGELIEID